MRRWVLITTLAAVLFIIPTISATTSLTPLWNATVHGDVNDIYVSDLDGDNTPEIIVGTDNGVDILNEDGKILWSIATIGKVLRVSAADFDGDGIKEVIAGTDYTDLGKISVYDASGKFLWSFQTGATHYWPDDKLNVKVIAVGDVDGDGKEEIVTGSNHYYWFPCRICVVGDRGKLEGEYWHPGWVGDVPPRAIYISDVDDDGDLEIAMGFVNNDYGYEGAVALFNGSDVHGEGPAYENGFDYGAGSQIWYWHSGSDYTGITSVHMYDINKDGYAEIIAGTGGKGTAHIYTFDYKGNLLWKYAGKFRSVFSADLNMDGRGEIIGGTNDGKIYCFSSNGSVIWKYLTSGSNAYIPFAGDIDEDRYGEVVAVSDKIYVLSGNGTLEYEYEERGIVTTFPRNNLIFLGRDTTVTALLTTPLRLLPPVVSITTDKIDYTTGDIMLTNITIANPTEETQHVIFNWWVTVPSKGFYTAPLATVPMTLPPSYNKTLTYTITVGYWGADNFGAVFCVALTNQTSGKIISFDATFWNYEARGAREAREKSIESIVSEIKRASHR